ncbi:MAG: hypothetical protein M1840_000116 [Geoglossum simile]|nr:MAG: hypothetical protein M1840_000116 [Geoglossum simile]
MAALYCSSSFSKLPNFIDLTGSGEDDDDEHVRTLPQAPVTVSQTSPTLPLEFSGAVQDTLLEAAKESTRRLVAGATVLSDGPSKPAPDVPSKRLNKSALVLGNPHRAVGQRPQRSSISAISPPSDSRRAVSKPKSPTRAHVQTTIEGFFHRPGVSTGQPDSGRGGNGTGNTGKGIAPKKWHSAREMVDELGLIEQISQSSLTNEEKAIFVRHFKHSGESHPSAEVSGSEPDVTKKGAIYLLRTQLFPYIVNVIDLFKDIKTLEERKQVGKETARKMFAKQYFRDTLLRSGAPLSSTRDNEIKALVKASFDEVIAERGRRVDVVDSGAKPAQSPGDDAHRGLDESVAAAGTLDGLSDIDMSEPEDSLVDPNKLAKSPTQGRTTPSKRTVDGVIKASSIGRVDGLLVPHRADDSIVADYLPKITQGNSGSSPKAATSSSGTRIHQHTLASGPDSDQQAILARYFATPVTSSSLQAFSPIRSYIVKLPIGRDRLSKFIAKWSSPSLAKPASKRRSTDLSTRRQLSSSKLRSKTRPSLPGVKTKTSRSEPGGSNVSRASKALNELSNSLQHLSTLVRSPDQQGRISNRQKASISTPLTPSQHLNAFVSPEVRTTVPPCAKKEVSPSNFGHLTQFQPPSLESVSPNETSSRRASRRLLGASPGRDVTQLTAHTSRQSMNSSRVPLLDKDHLMSMVKAKKPFVSDCHRDLLQKGILEEWWTNGKVLHVDFSNDEMSEVLRVIERSSSTATATTLPNVKADLARVVAASLVPFADFLERPTREKVMALASKMTEADVLSASARLLGEESLHGRDVGDICRFLKDAALGRLAMSPTIIHVASPAPPIRRGDHVFSASTDSLLRRRELGLGHARANWHSTEAIESELKLRVFDAMREWRSWRGGSSDAASVAWDITGEHFAVGFSAVTDAYNMQYNRRNNLMVGDMWTNTIKEFPHHRVPRPRTDLVNVVDDLYLYQTVSQVKFGAKGRCMYSASFDKTIKIWDFAADNTQDRLLATLHQGADVDLMALSADEHLATGSRDGKATVKVWNINEDDPSLSRIHCSFNSSRRPTVYPTCMQWGPHASVCKYLLVGFSGCEENRNGDIIVWDADSGSQVTVSPAAINTFDAAWHPSMPAFVVGCKRPGSDSTRKSVAMRTSVRTFHPISGSFKDQFELGCPAYDINDVTWRHVNIFSMKFDS